MQFKLFINELLKSFTGSEPVCVHQDGADSRINWVQGLYFFRNFLLLFHLSCVALTVLAHVRLTPTRGKGIRSIITAFQLIGRELNSMIEGGAKWIFVCGNTEEVRISSDMWTGGGPEKTIMSC